VLNFPALSILLIHRELLSDGKGLINTVHDGIPRGFQIRKKMEKIKGEKYRMLMNLNRLFVWRQIGLSLKTNNLKGVFVYG